MAAAKKNSWSASANLLATSAVTGRGGRAVSLQADFKDAPGNYTLQFDAQIPTPAVGQTFRPLAEIFWSVEGNSVRRLISVARGVSVTGSGQGVRARIFDDSVNGTGEEYNVSMQVVKGMRANVQQPPTLLEQESQIIAAAGSATFIIPDNAGVISAYVSMNPRNGADAPVENDEFIIRFNSSTTLTTYGLLSVGTWIPIPPGCRSVVLVNNRPAGSIDANVTWGIEG